MPLEESYCLVKAVKGEKTLAGIVYVLILTSRVTAVRLAMYSLLHLFLSETSKR